jgi:hypothetical protein
MLTRRRQSPRSAERSSPVNRPRRCGIQHIKTSGNPTAKSSSPPTRRIHNELFKRRSKLVVFHLHRASSGIYFSLQLQITLTIQASLLPLTLQNLMNPVGTFTEVIPSGYDKATDGIVSSARIELIGTTNAQCKSASSMTCVFR